MANPHHVSQLSDKDVLSQAKVAAAREREATAVLIALLAQIDARRLCLGEGCSSLFTYCTQVLHLSEHAAYGRIEAARASRRFPVLLDLLTDGAVTLTAVTLLAPHLTGANHVEVLAAARHKTKREIEQIVARLRPRPDAPAQVRRLPTSQMSVATPLAVEAAHSSEPTACRPAPSPPRPAVVAPLAPQRYKMQFTVSHTTYDKLRRIQDLLRHSIPTGDPAAIVDRVDSVAE